MKVVPLREVADINMGQAPSGEFYNDDGVGFPLIAGAGDFGGIIPKTKRFTTHAAKRSIAGDIILCVRATIGDLNLADREYCLGRGVAGIRAKPGKSHARYIWWALDHNKAELAARGKGATFKQVNRSDIETLPVPLPPLDEQRRIAAILDQADELRRKRRDAINKFDLLGAEVFKSLLSKSDTVDLEKFPDIVYFQEGPGVRNWQFRDTGTKLVNVRNIVNGELILNNTNRYISNEEARGKYKHFLLDSGDFVLASSGVTWGKIAEVQERDLPLCLNTSMIRIVKRSTRIESSYLRAFIEYGSFRAQIDRIITGSAQPNFGPSHLSRVEIPIPPIDAQRRFQHFTMEVRQAREACADHLAKLDRLFASLQHRAFRGEL